MVNDWTRRHGLLLSLLPVGAILFLLTVHSYAATTYLRDIRIGEYEVFTRIVFEFNVQTEVEYIKKEPSGKLTIVFPSVHPELIRQIPAQYKERLSDIRIFEQQNQMMVVFYFNSNTLRFDTFQLNSPPRWVLDIHQQPPPQTASPGAENKKLPGTSDPALKPPGHTIKPSPSASGLSADHQPFEKVIINTEQIKNHVKTPTPLSLIASTDDQPLSGNLPETIAPSMESDSSILPIAQPSNAMGNSSSTPERDLFYYLLIALVVLTIAILMLLIIMLIARHKWTDGKKTLKLDDILHRQDEHIASINSQIEEQLKRYNEI